MFWDSFAGKVKGPSIFWEKEWGIITSDSYSAHIVPIIHGWIQLTQL